MQVPLHLQVGWNSSVPQCVDAEPPVFQNCPANPIFAQTDAFGQLLPVQFAEPEASDNSGVVAYVKTEPRDFRPPFPVHAPLDVTYTAYDEAGNSAECVVQLRVPGEYYIIFGCSGDATLPCRPTCYPSCYPLLLADTQPPAMKCPESYTLPAAANETTRLVHFNQSDVHVVVHDLSPVPDFRLSPEKAELRLFQAVDVEATATDSHGNRASCRFQVALMRECSSFQLILV